jgi:protein-arginine kinase activator protein McsA
MHRCPSVSFTLFHTAFAVEEQEFEKAAALRERIKALTKELEKST